MVKKNRNIVVITGPSGVGKDTVIDIMVVQSDFEKLPTCTTRPKRHGEVNGAHYHFLSEEDFFSLYDGNKLLDHVVISGYRYGLPMQDVFKAIDQKRNIVIHLTAGSALLFKHIVPEAILVFIMPPSYTELIRRLRNRGMKEEDIIIRLHDNPASFQLVPQYDFIVVNHENDERNTAEKIMSFINKAQKDRQQFSLTSTVKKNIVKYMYPQFFATKNLNKLREINKILGKEFQQIEVELCEPQELDVIEVVKEKARDAFQKTGKLVLVEDTSLEFVTWNGLPGALIKWFLQSVGNEGILRMFQQEKKNRSAIAKTAIGFYDGTESHVFLGEVRGIIPTEIRGKSGFGWDPIFIPENHTKSFAEMTTEEKNEISMRKIALARLEKFFNNRITNE